MTTAILIARDGTRRQVAIPKVQDRLVIPTLEEPGTAPAPLRFGARIFKLVTDLASTPVYLES